MYIGIDLGGTNIAVGIVNDNKEVIAKNSVPTGIPRDYKEIVFDMQKLVNKLLEQQGIKKEEVKGLGIGCPGTIVSKDGIVAYANNLGMNKVPLIEEMKKYFDFPMCLLNDADAAAYGEYIVNGNDAESFIMVTLGTGVGGGIIINGKIYNGFNGAGGEIGHTILVHNGIECTCGNKGCWESYASVTALIRQTKEKMEQYPQSAMHEYAKKEGKINGRTSFAVAKSGDKAAIEVVNQYLEYVSSGLVSIINIFQPEKVVIGGGISREGDYLLNPIKEYCNKHDYNRYLKKADIGIATLFNDAGIIGAALYSDK